MWFPLVKGGWAQTNMVIRYYVQYPQSIELHWVTLANGEEYEITYEVAKHLRDKVIQPNMVF